jgi:hypothetical protein
LSHDIFSLLLYFQDGDDNGFSSLDAQSYLKNGLSVGAATTTSASMASLVLGPDRLKPSSTHAATCKPKEGEHEVCFSGSCACRKETRMNCSSSCTSHCSETCWGNQFDPVNSPEQYVEVEDDLAYFSSIGPTSDGRWKPDLVAPGFYIASAHSTVYFHEIFCIEKSHGIVFGCNFFQLSLPTPTPLFSLYVPLYVREVFILVARSLSVP